MSKEESAERKRRAKALVKGLKIGKKIDQYEKQIVIAPTEEDLDDILKLVKKDTAVPKEDKDRLKQAIEAKREEVKLSAQLRRIERDPIGYFERQIAELERQSTNTEKKLAEIERVRDEKAKKVYGEMRDRKDTPDIGSHAMQVDDLDEWLHPADSPLIVGQQRREKRIRELREIIKFIKDHTPKGQPYGVGFREYVRKRR